MINYKVVPHSICNNSLVLHFLMSWLVFEMWPTEDEVFRRWFFDRKFENQNYKVNWVQLETVAKNKQILLATLLPQSILLSCASSSVGHISKTS